MGAVFAERGFEVSRAPIEFTDSRYINRFADFPMRHPFVELIRMLPAQLRRGIGEIRIPNEAKPEFDLICIGSPTWWLTTNMPIRSFLESAEAARLLNGTRFSAVVPCRRYWRNNLRTVKRLGTEHGGQFVGGIHFTYPANQIGSLLSLLSYLGKGDHRERFLGVNLPPTNIQPAHLDAVRAFAAEISDQITTSDHSTAAPSIERGATAEQKP